MEGREEVRAGVGCRQSRGQGPKQDVDWLFSEWLQAFRQGSGKTQILLCLRLAPEKQSDELSRGSQYVCLRAGHGVLILREWAWRPWTTPESGPE